MLLPAAQAFVADLLSMSAMTVDDSRYIQFVLINAKQQSMQELLSLVTLDSEDGSSFFEQVQHLASLVLQVAGSLNKNISQSRPMQLAVTTVHVTVTVCVAVCSSGVTVAQHTTTAGGTKLAAKKT